MANEYPEHIRREARRLWLGGRMTFPAVATKLGIPRGDTIRGWCREEGWWALAEDLTKVVKARVNIGIEEKEGALKAKYDQLTQVIESRAVRALSNPHLATKDLRALASTLSLALRIRKDLGQGSARDRLEGTLAALMADESGTECEDAERLGRCVEGAETQQADE